METLNQIALVLSLLAVLVTVALMYRNAIKSADKRFQELKHQASRDKPSKASSKGREHDLTTA